MNCFWNMFDVVYSLPTCIKGVNNMYVYLLPTSRVWFRVFSGYKSVYYVFIACKFFFDAVHSLFDAVFSLPIFRVWYCVSIAYKWCLMLYILRLMLCYHCLYVVIWCCLFTIYWLCLVLCIYFPALSLLDVMYFMPFDAMNYLHLSRVSCFYVVWPSLVAIQVSIQWS